MDMPKFFLVLWTHDTNDIFFRDFMESMVAQVYDNWELYVIDNNEGWEIERILMEFFPEDARIHYRKLKNNKGQAYAYNIGLHFIMPKTTHVLFLQQYDRLEAHALYDVADWFMKHPKSEMIYSDHDELYGTERKNPHYKSDWNVELLLHQNYIGDFCGIRLETIHKLGFFKERLSFSCMYEYYLRLMKNRCSIGHIPTVLYHKRMMAVDDKKLEKRMHTKAYREHMAVAQTYLLRLGSTGIVEPEAKELYWKIAYPVKQQGKDSYRRNKKRYMLLHDKNVKVYTRNAAERLYGIIQQADVAVVGIRYIKGAMTIDNCGYIFDTNGLIYPALYQKKIYHESYENRAKIPQDVSMVDFGFCMLDAKIYQKLGGFDQNLTGRDLMLDYCLRARKAGYRIVIEPEIIGRKRVASQESSQESYERLMQKHQDVILKGDPYYNPNLMMGLENYVYLPETDEKLR